ncbi:MAG TPA: cyanophycin synthetase, partial [Rhodothermia bacterium]|nr:cyanophycin synthetase [Rhodothermia bacterium]
LCLTSPHVYSVRERIRLNGVALTWERLGAVLERIIPCLEQMRGSEWHPHPTDIWTWVALALHASTSTTHGVYEVSKGGGSDVINVFSRGVVGLTNIGHDHLEEFGDSQESLLQEKLGLCSTGDTLCYNPLEDRLERQLANYCRDRTISAIRIPETVSTSIPHHRFDHEHIANVELARGIVERIGVDPARMGRAVPGLICRIQPRVVEGRRFILDGAHNPEAMKRIVSRFEIGAKRRRVVVFGVQDRKDWRALTQLLSRIPGLKTMICVPMTTGDSVDARDLAHGASAYGLRGVTLPGMLSGLKYVLSRDWDECLVTGSFKLFRDFDLTLHALGYGAWALPVEYIDPPQPWMRPLV